jgi:VanZ family protein
VTLRYPRVYLALGRALILVIIVLSLAPLPAPPLHVAQGDKIGHALAYFVLTAWYAQLFDVRGGLLWRAAAFVALGGAIELVQPYVNRDAEWLDLGADLLGVLLGLMLALTPAARLLQRLEASAPRR